MRVFSIFDPIAPRNSYVFGNAQIVVVSRSNQCDCYVVIEAKKASSLGRRRPQLRVHNLKSGAAAIVFQQYEFWLHLRSS
jgi:hypothetical protein